jgi:Flp pilus assembly protein TadB
MFGRILMFRKILTLALACLLFATQTGASVFAASRVTQDAETLSKVRANIDRAGLGEKARVTLKLKDGTKRKGYVSERRDAEFVLRDRKTDDPTVVAYRDVNEVKIDRGHSTARNTALGVGIGAGAVIIVLAVIFASLDD